jgi:hypothetical protein
MFCSSPPRFALQRTPDGRLAAVISSMCLLQICIASGWVAGVSHASKRQAFKFVCACVRIMCVHRVCEIERERTREKERDKRVCKQSMHSTSARKHVLWLGWMCLHHRQHKDSSILSIDRRSITLGER